MLDKKWVFFYSSIVGDQWFTSSPLLLLYPILPVEIVNGHVTSTHSSCPWCQLLWQPNLQTKCSNSRLWSRNVMLRKKKSKLVKLSRVYVSCCANDVRERHLPVFFQRFSNCYETIGCCMACHFWPRYYATFLSSLSREGVIWSRPNNYLKGFLKSFRSF